jgi:peroxiredoxin
MALAYSESGKLGSHAPNFSLPGVDGRKYSLNDFTDAKALLVVFMCNHCPYVIATRNRINELARNYGPKGVKVVAISSNDASRYPDDSFEEMKATAAELGFVFPYLYDETQSVAQAYGAVCTPEFYAYAPKAGQFVLKYLGRLDDNWKDEKAVTRHDLADALDEILSGRDPNMDQKPALGCSIKWKAKA